MKNVLKKIFVLSALMLVSLFIFTACGEEQSSAKIVVLEDNLGAEKYGIGFRKDDVALCMEVQKVFDEMLEDGTAKTISEKWFGTDIMLYDEEIINDVTEPVEDDDSLQKILDKGVLVLGLDDQYPPMGFRDENNEIVGFDIDLATEVCERLGIELQVTPIDWNSKELELSTGKIDCIWNGMTITDERIEQMCFGKAYIANNQLIYTLEGSGINSVEDLAGKVVGYQDGSSSYDALYASAAADTIKEGKAYPDNVTAFMDLKLGRIDALVVDQVVGDYYLVQQGEN